MSIIKYTSMDQLDEMDKMMQEMQGVGFAPVINVYETDKNIVIEASLAGVKPDDVEISIANDVLTIRGQVKKESEVEEKNYYRKEIRNGSFFRSISLPAHIDGDSAEAESVEGMLKIVVPKRLENKPKTIKIKIKKMSEYLEGNSDK